MSTAIRVENLSKQYIIQHQGQTSGNGFRHVLQDALAAPFRKLRSLCRERGRASSALPGSRDGRSEEFWALRQVSFEIEQGDVVGIIGRNGAGKSTLLKVLSRITEPTAGKVHLNGRVASLLEVGTGFHPELTGRENIFLNGAILGMTHSEIRSKFDEIVAFAEVEKFLDTPVKRYSSGMYVRLAFAVAAHLEPEILIVDEVLAVGDNDFQKKCLGKMQDVARTGARTVLFVSHSMGAIRRLCNRAILLSGGTVIDDGPTASVVDHYVQLGAGTLIPSIRHDLRTHSRRGSGEQRFEELVIHSGRHRSIETKGTVVFETTVYSNDDAVIDSYGVTISSQDGTRLVAADTMSFCIKVPLRKGRNTIVLTIPSLPLKPGFYPVTLWMGRGGVHAIDFLQDLGDLEVHPPHDSLFVPLPSDTSVYCEFSVESGG